MKIFKLDKFDDPEEDTEDVVGDRPNDRDE